MLSLKFYWNWRTFDRVMSKYRRVRFFETHTVAMETVQLVLSQ